MHPKNINLENNFECILKLSFLDRKRKLIINPSFIEFEDNDLAIGRNTKFDSEEIDSFRFGIKWINGYKFTIGRTYFIDIKSTTGKIIKLKLKSIYGIRKNELHHKYVTIVDKLIDFQFINIAKKYINQHRNAEDFTLLSIKFIEVGIQLKNKKIISWEDLATKQYNNKYSLFSKNNNNCYIVFEYDTDWNTAVLYSVVEQILLDKKSPTTK